MPYNTMVTLLKGAMGTTTTTTTEETSTTNEQHQRSEEPNFEVKRIPLPELKEMGSSNDDDDDDDEIRDSPNNNSPNNKFQNKKKKKRKKNCSIEIKDPSGKCVQLEKQLAAVHRAVIHPLEREIALLKTSQPQFNESCSNPELEIILMQSLTMDGCGSSFGGYSTGPNSPSTISSPIEKKDAKNGDDNDNNNDNDNDTTIERPPLVDQQLRYQIEGELLGMRDSLERNQEWRSFYAYHLERFRQMHNILTQQYHETLQLTDKERHYAQTQLSVYQRDEEANRSMMAHSCEEVIQSKKEVARVERTFQSYQRQMELKVKAAKQSHRATVLTIEEDLKICVEEIECMEIKMKKLEVAKKEGKAAKRLNEVLNDKLQGKTREAAKLFAENLKLREEAMIAKQELAQQQHSSDPAGFIARNRLLTEQLRQAHMQLAERDAELEETREECTFHQEEVDRIHMGSRIDKEFNDELCETLESALTQVMAENDTQSRELEECRQTNSTMRVEFRALQSDWETERECTERDATSLREQLAEATVVIDEQNHDLEICQSEIICLTEQLAALEIEAERDVEWTDTLSRHVQEVLHMRESQSEELFQASLDNSVLRDQVDDLEAEVEVHVTNLEHTASRFADKLTEATTVTADKVAAWEESQKDNAVLTERIAVLQSELQNAGNDDNLRAEIQDLQMEKSLLEYEVSQLKSHLESVMEENVYLSDTVQTNADKVEVAERRNETLTEQVGHLMCRVPSVAKSLDMFVMNSANNDDDNDSIAISQVLQELVAPTLSGLMLDLPNFTEDKLDESIKKQFNYLDATMRDNEKLLLQVTRSGISGASREDADVMNSLEKETLPDIVVSPTDEVESQSERFPLFLADGAPLSGLLIDTLDNSSNHDGDDDVSVSSSASSVAPQINGMASMDKDRSFDIMSQMAPAAPFVDTTIDTIDGIEQLYNDMTTQLRLSASQQSSQDLASMPSDELGALKQFIHAQQLRDESGNLMSSPVAKSSMLLADHLIEVLEGKEGSDDAVLQQMDALRELLFEDDTAVEVTSQNDVDEISAFLDCDEELLISEFSTEVTEAEFCARQLFDRLLISKDDDGDVIDDSEWADCLDGGDAFEELETNAIESQGSTAEGGSYDDDDDDYDFDGGIALLQAELKKTLSIDSMLCGDTVDLTMPAETQVNSKSACSTPVDEMECHFKAADLLAAELDAVPSCNSMLTDGIDQDCAIKAALSATRSSIAAEVNAGTVTSTSNSAVADTVDKKCDATKMTLPTTSQPETSGTDQLFQDELAAGVSSESMLLDPIASMDSGPLFQDHEYAMAIAFLPLNAEERRQEIGLEITASGQYLEHDSMNAPTASLMAQRRAVMKQLLCSRERTTVQRAFHRWKFSIRS